jgi:enoyl-CoA hydratase
MAAWDRWGLRHRTFRRAYRVPVRPDPMSEEILFGREGRLATVTINRPQALNALTLANYREIAPKLPEWAADVGVAGVLVRGTGERAFCAGGDVRDLYEAGRGIAGDPALPRDFFREEYRLIRQIHRYPKPWIAIIAGITMGGGAGISVNGAYPIATERTRFAMPETGIGLFPDVGATRFLNRCPGAVGRYIGLAGPRLAAADTLYCGLARHVVAQDRIDALVAALGKASGPDDVDRVLGEFAVDPGPPPLAGLRPAIDRCFSADTVETILERLEAEAAGGEHAAWAAETHSELLKKSPTSLKITLRQLTLGMHFDIEAALSLEYRLTQHVMARHDFYEGVRAMLIDRDQKPAWRPATLAEVAQSLIEAHFEPLGEGELTFA